MIKYITESLNIFGLIWILFCFQLEEIFSSTVKECYGINMTYFCTLLFTLQKCANVLHWNISKQPLVRYSWNALQVPVSPYNNNNNNKSKLWNTGIWQSHDLSTTGMDVQFSQQWCCYISATNAIKW